MNEGRGSWYLLTGLLLGIALGLVYGWLIEPAQYVDVSPAALKPAEKERYRALVALAYQMNGDAGRARARLALLNDPNPALAASLQAERWQADKATAREARALALLAGLFVQPGAATAPAATAGPSATRNLTALALISTRTEEVGQVVRSATPVPSATRTVTPTATLTPVFTFTPRPTVLAPPTQGAPYVLKEQTRVCLLETPGWLQFEVLNARGEPVPGVRIQVTWNGGQETFYTGFAPEISLGYADFVMNPKVIYAIRVGEGGETLTGISIPDCLITSMVGGFKLKYQQ